MKTKLKLQRLTKDGWCTVNVLNVVPYTKAGFETCMQKLHEFSCRWEHNYPDFFGSKWRID